MTSTHTASINALPWMEDEEMHEDEWFFQSIKRYDHLFMYHLSMSVTFMRVSPKGDKITIVGKTIKSKDQGMPASMKEFLEIGVFSICPKLLVPCHTEQGLNNKRDFALLAGARMKTGSLDIKQTLFLTDVSIVTVSSKCVGIWQINEGTDVLTLIASYKHESGYLVGCEIMDSRHIYCFDESRVIRLSGNIDTGSINAVAESPLQPSTILDMALTDRLVSVVTSEGLMTTLERDVLTHEREVNLGTGVLNSAVICKSDPSVVAFVKVNSSGVHIRLPDGRIISNTDINGIKANPTPMHFNRLDCLLVRDDKEIKVYRASSNGIEELFTHDGHRNEVTCVCTHPQVEGLHFSSDQKGYLHAWQLAQD